MDIISKKEAMRESLRTYFTGKPCKKGHVYTRYVISGACCICIKGYNRRLRGKIKAYRFDIIDERDVPTAQEFVNSLNLARNLEGESDV